MADDLFALDQDTLDTVALGLDSLIHQLGKDCKLIYESEKQICPNCIFDPAANRSTNVYNGVGTKPFQSGKCPVCKGVGYLPGVGMSEDVTKFLIDWQPRPWFFTDPTTQIRVPQGLVQTKGFVTDMPKVIQAKYLIIDYTNTALTSNRFIRWGEPVIAGNIVKSRYFVCFWQRYGS